VVVVPLRIGGGTRLKVVEAMSMNKAIVSTTLGCEGISATHGENIVLADTSMEFADAVCTLLAAPAERRRMGGKARGLVSESYSWGKAADHLNDLIQRVVSPATGALAARSSR
jgi:glycosyltransferase involved in cell wall biosynthesis